MLNDSNKLIKETLPKEELYCQLAEEAAELSQAASKKARKMRGVNPTPKTMEECDVDVIEELSDVVLLAELLNLEISPSVMHYKANRWASRLKEGC